MKLDKDNLKQLLQVVANTRSDEIGCDECFQKLDRFAEHVLAGKDAEAAMPLVQNHLDVCGQCRREFEALLDVLKEVS